MLVDLLMNLEVMLEVHCQRFMRHNELFVARFIHDTLRTGTVAVSAWMGWALVCNYNDCLTHEYI